MRRLTSTLTTFAAISLFAGATVASAAPITNATGIASPAVTILFSEFGLAADTVITNQYSSLGVTFSPNVYQNPQGFPGPNVDLGPNSASNFSFSGGPIVSPFSIFFNTDQTQAAFAMITNANTSTFGAYLNSVLVESFSIATGPANPNNFYGFSGILFDEIRVTVGGDGNAIFDNLQIGSVPEPTTILLMGLGLAALARRRRV
jgi:hypothetical protein